MGRKQGQAVSAKVTKESGKPMEQGHVQKQQHSKSQRTETSRRGPLKSKARFTLYPETKVVADLTSVKTQTSSLSSQKLPHSKSKPEEQFVQEEEVISQIQAEKAKAEEAAAIVIPTACEDTTSYNTFNILDVGTPFNKRLVSSTPDPERLLEAELQDQHEALSSLFCPQMVPERDIVHPQRVPMMLTSGACGLSDKLELQRQQFHEYQQLLQPQQHKMHQVQQHQQSFPLVQHHDDDIFVQKKNPPFGSSADIPVMAPSTLTVNKAEWVADTDKHSNLNVDKSMSRLIRCTKNSNQLSPRRATSVNSAFGAVSSVADTKSKEADDIITSNLSVAHLYKPVSDSMKLPPSSAHLGSQALLSEQIPDKNGQHSALKPLTPRSDKLSGRTKSNFNTNEKLESHEKESVTLEKQGSHFSKPNIPMEVQNSLPEPSSALPVTPGKITLHESTPCAGKNIVSKPRQPDRSVSPKKGISYKPLEQDNKPALMKEKNKNTELNGRDEIIYLGAEKLEPDLKMNSHLSKAEKVINTGASPKTSIQTEEKGDDLDTSSDTCYMEIASITKPRNEIIVDMREIDTGQTEKIYSKGEEDDAASASDSANLSQVIEFLKSEAFNKMKENEVMDHQPSDGAIVGIDETNNKDDETAANFLMEKKQCGDDSQSLAQLMSLYLPTADKNNMSNNSRNSDFGDVNDKIFSKEPVSDCGKKGVGVNVNQNYFSDEDDGGYISTSRRPKNLQHLERMVDPRLREIACRLAFKATALRDVELRDLIDDMIFHTNAALRHEDARLQTTQMFFVEENSKLKKRIQNINQQLDAKERQERMGATTLGVSDNDVLILEKKIMSLRQEKDKLDSQVTTLLEEKAKWLITQQDLVRAVSLKDHEILKLEEKHHEEKKKLHQSLDQATKISQGVHYKLTVADREIANLEQTVRCRDVEIVDLKERLKRTEARLINCETYSKRKDQELTRLQDLVDTLKIGVDHVLQAYESSSARHTTADARRRGMDALRQMAHPEECRTTLLKEHVTKDQAVGRDYHYSDSSRPHPHERPHLHERPYPHERPHPYERHHSVEDISFRPGHSRQHICRRDDGQDVLPSRLTHRTLEEHNRRLSPVDRTLWRSLDDGKTAAPVLGEDPYYSDSEFELNGRGSRRRSHIRHYGARTGNLQQHSSLPHTRSTMTDGVYRDKKVQRGDQSTKYFTITLGDSDIGGEASRKEPLSDETYLSTLRSKSLSHEERLPDSHHQPSVHSNTVLRKDDLSPGHHSDSSKSSSHFREYDSDLVELASLHETHHPRFLSVSHPAIRHSRDSQVRSIRQKHTLAQPSQVPGRSRPGDSRTLKEQKDHFATLEPERLSFEAHGTSQAPHHFQTSSHPHLDHYEHQYSSTSRSNREQHTSHKRQTHDKLGETGGSVRHLHHGCPGENAQRSSSREMQERPSFSVQRSSLPADDSPSYINNISISRRATRGSDTENLTQREFFQGTELSASLSTISEPDFQASINTNELDSLNENPFSTGLADLDEKIASLRRKIDRTKAMFS